jgi:hypothetical protein
LVPRPYSYGSASPQCPTTLDNSPPATPCQAKELQIAIIGYLLYYGRAVDARLLPANCVLASDQASPTTATIARLDRHLGYTAAHPNGRKVYRASTMVLRYYSDASYLSRPRAGSVAGGHYFLGDLSDTAPVNHPSRPTAPAFPSSAPEWQRPNSPCIATNERQILANMGHPQPPTPIFCDNEVAIGLATDSRQHQRTSKCQSQSTCDGIGSGIGFDKDTSAPCSSPASAITPIFSPKPCPWYATSFLYPFLPSIQMMTSLLYFIIILMYYLNYTMHYDFTLHRAGVLLYIVLV